MDNETLFYVCGILLALSAVVVSFLGLKTEKFAGRASALVAIWFIALVGGTTTFAVLHAQDEHAHEDPALEKATEEAERAENEGVEAAP
ncbi:MAG TPA: hypothetical protein VFY04_00455 [Solirubrobacterales bacterium]|nr:hypothetical protein [Solirubrobacterales bacterium]